MHLVLIELNGMQISSINQKKKESHGIAINVIELGQDKLGRPFAFASIRLDKQIPLRTLSLLSLPHCCLLSTGCQLGVDVFGEIIFQRNHFPNLTTL